MVGGLGWRMVVVLPRGVMGGGDSMRMLRGIVERIVSCDEGAVFMLVLWARTRLPCWILLQWLPMWLADRTLTAHGKVVKNHFLDLHVVRMAGVWITN